MTKNDIKEGILISGKKEGEREKKSGGVNQKRNRREEDKVREGKLGTEEEEERTKNDGMIIELTGMDHENPKGLVRMEEKGKLNKTEQLIKEMILLKDITSIVQLQEEVEKYEE